MRNVFFFFFHLIPLAFAQAQLFTDEFSRGSDPGPLAPWTAQSGAWSITGGALKGGTNAGNSFSFLYTTNSWTNYSVQARVRFSTVNADGGGIGGRLNPFSGGHYAVWISPEGSADPSTLQIAKFQYWFGYEYTNTTWQVMQRVSLPSVGTNWHTVKLTFEGNQIAVYYDSNLVASATDTESNPFLAGGIVAGMSTATVPYNMFVDDVVVTPAPSILLALNGNYSVAQNGSLTVAAPGVLAFDIPGALTNLSAIRLANPTKGTLTFNTNGGFTYVPSNNFVGIDSFTYQATDGTATSAWATATIDVLPSTNIFYDNFTRSGTSNALAPWVIGLGEWSVAGGVLLGTGTVSDYYSDAYIPGAWGDFSVQTRFQLPTGAWACGVSGRLNPLTGERYVANVYPETSPYKPTPSIRLIKFHSWGTWSDSYTPMAQVSLASVGTSYHTLKMAFYGNNIDVYFDGTRVIHAVDNMVDGIPFYRSGAFGAHMYMYSPYQATFDDYNVSLLPGINFPPVLPAQTNRTIGPLATLVVTNTATDPDVPVNPVAYTLVNPPTGAAIDTNGVISWTPSPGQDLTTNIFTTIVTDSNLSATNSQHLSATNSFTVVVNSRPVLAVDSTALVYEGCAPANGAIDSGEYVTVLFALKNTGLNNTTNLVATLLGTGGVVGPSGPQTYGVIASGGTSVTQAFSFSAGAACGSTLSATLQLQDRSTSLGSVSVPFIIGQTGTIFTQTFDTVTAPAFPAGWSTSSSGAESNWVTQTVTNSSPPNAAFSPDPSNIGVNQLISPVIQLPNGPCQLSFAHFFDLETNTPVEAFDGAVLEIKIGGGSFADILTAGGSFVTNGYTYTISTNWGNPLGGRQAWSGRSPGFIRTIVNLPVSAGGQSVQLQWRCGTDNSNGRSGWRVDSIGITGRLCCTNAYTNTAPVLTVPANQVVNELNTLNVSALGTDSDVPANTLTFSLVSAPSGMTIYTNTGAISWTPTEAQGPSTNIVTVRVTDNGTPNLSDTKSFAVIVNEVNTAPVLIVPTNQFINPLSLLNVAASATDSDIPTNILTFSLASAPDGMTINTNTGAISWIPTEAQAGSTNTITVIVTDNGMPNLNDTNSFLVVVYPLPFIQAIEVTNGVAVLTCKTVPGQTYRLQSKDLFLNTIWTNLLPDVTATESVTVMTNGANGSDQKLYRLLLVK